MSNSIVGLLAFSEDVVCKKEVLGQSFSALIGGINTCLLFPEYNEANNDVGDRNPLLPPRVFSSGKGEVTQASGVMYVANPRETV